jgi:putative oxidoreductase
MLRALFGATPSDLGLLVIRLFFGSSLALAHGFAKFVDLGGFADKIANKVPLAGVLGPAAGLSEFVGGLLLALGLFTRPAAFFVLVTMSVAGFYIHAADPFMKKELAFAYASAALAILIAGPGSLSLDRRGG